ncbi:metalloproteinase inhibitor 4 [Latimeria chalumnae]|uniref:Metalloproteinase inhibitor 4 n=1 Tax=Latimeria chalumnae TaxID=7897 RepID=H3AS43_LATCH|nr:PREDICTED: metalloproteinase inhibitor 4 [Latimeria chalumnae]|eukprot:XP_006004476.1 PREDICTED: metalloproteinase inhibitor 4 [Latimeria chalumnae]
MRTPVSGLLASVLLLLTLRLQELVDACSCAPTHPQDAFCRSDIVIRAKISGEKMVYPVNSSITEYFKMIQYEIKQVKMFKGFEKVKDVQYVYTSLYSSLCGVKLEASNKKQYLLSGRISNDGKVHISLCNFIVPWDELSLSQKKSLNHRYQMGCDCRISRCYTLPCSTTAANECLWTDRLIEKKLYGYQAKYYACIKRSDGSCSWYRGGPPPEKEFIDITDP